MAPAWVRALEFAAVSLAVAAELPAVLVPAVLVVADQGEVLPVVVEVVLLLLADREVVHLALQAEVLVEELPVV